DRYSLRTRFLCGMRYARLARKSESMITVSCSKCHVNNPRFPRPDRTKECAACPTDRKECAMQIDRPGRDSERGPAEQFSGSVWTDVIAAPSQSSPVAVYIVHFAPGARTAWHAHPAGQVLHVTEGAGLVQVRSQRPEEIRAGDTV